MKLLITGANGQLGTELRRQLAAGGSALGPLPERLEYATITTVDIEDADLTDRKQAATLIRRHAPEAVINCAAFTAVDAAESERDAAFAANALAPRNLALACEEVGAKLIHLSTDYVFDGSAAEPYAETARPNPATVYGATKLLGEEYVRQFCTRWFIMRTSWLYGRNGNNFVKTMLRLADERDSISVVDDQHGNPTNAEDLAHHLLQLVPTKHYGLYHCTGKGTCSWYQFTQEIMRLAGKTVGINPCTTDEYTKMLGRSQAARPANSSLEHTMLRLSIGDNMRPWQDALAAYITEL